MPIYILVVRDFHDFSQRYSHWQILRVIQCEMADAEDILNQVYAHYSSASHPWTLNTIILDREPDSFLRTQAVDYTDPATWE